MKYLEEIIIGSSFGEGQFSKVSFLEPGDFKNYPGKPYRTFWKLAKQNGIYNHKLIDIITKTNDENLIRCLSACAFIPAVNNPEFYGLKLLEQRFKSLLSELLSQLSMESTNEIERKLLEESYMEVGRQDVFELSDGIMDYLGIHISDHSKNRIKAFLEYMDKRAKQAKDVISRIS